MIEIKPIENWEECGGLLEERYHTKESFAMAATENGRVIAAGAIRLLEDCAYLLEIAVGTEDAGAQLAYGMGKALLNFADRRQAVHIYCSNQKLFPLLTRLRFHKTEEDAMYYLNLTNYFTNHC